MCGWPPTCKNFLRDEQWSLAVICPAFQGGLTRPLFGEKFPGSRRAAPQGGVFLSNHQIGITERLVDSAPRHLSCSHIALAQSRSKKENGNRLQPAVFRRRR
jgi:hypothetical protein